MKTILIGLLLALTLVSYYFIWMHIPAMTKFEVGFCKAKYQSEEAVNNCLDEYDRLYNNSGIYVLDNNDNLTSKSVQ